MREQRREDSRCGVRHTKHWRALYRDLMRQYPHEDTFAILGRFDRVKEGARKPATVAPTLTS